MASWLGRSKMYFDAAERTIPIPLLAATTQPETNHDNSSSTDSPIDGTNTQSFLDLCKQATPPCHLNPLLFNGHVQTFWTAVKGVDIPITYKRKIFESKSTVYGNGGTFAVDFVVHTPKSARNEAVKDDPTLELPPRTTYYTEEEFSSLGCDDTKPLLIMLHGLAGGSHEIYLRHVLRPLCLDAASDDERWEALVVNARGCAHSKITSGVLYNARATWDVRQVVLWAKEKWPNRKLFGIGFSLGANILTNYLGEEGSACPLDAALVVSNPWNLEVSNLILQSTYLGLNVYSKIMADSMRQLFMRNQKEITSQIPAIDAKKLLSSKYLHEFDRYVQCPTWGWPSVGAYYRDASCIDAVIDVRIPLFAIHAKDDPIVADVGAPYEEVKHNGYVVLCSTSLGGHLSWFEPGGERWFSRVAESWLRKMATEVDFKALRAERETSTVGVQNEMTSSGSPNKREMPVYRGVVRKLQDRVDLVQ
ncbi:alpha/beta fold family hydrolase [Venturia nashicola]|uniref:alcohol O-acetyltransferase n=1 Tax=Venturia nashicola TaxID=86259 RepID=A0A4Z1PEP9_9PEZI|nr:alpha/beta fold family hydrolase [Venturia nashicola]